MFKKFKKMFTPKEDIALDYELNEDVEMKEERKIRELAHKGFKKRFKTDYMMLLTLSHSHNK